MTEVARLSVVVDANVAAAAKNLKGMDAQFAHTATSAKKMDAAITASSARANAAMSSTGRTARTQYVGMEKASQQATKAHQQVAVTSAKTSRGVSKDSAAMRAAMAGAGTQGAMMGTAVQGGAAAVAYGLFKSIKSAADFDSAMRNVNSIAGLSEAKFKNLSARVLDLAGPTAQAPMTLADGMYQLVSSGFNASESLTVMKASAIAATAGLTDAETATTAIAGALNAYELKASDAQTVSDLLFTTVDKGVLTFNDLAQGLGPVLPFATKLGVELDQVGAMLASLTIKGVPAAEAMTYTKGAMAQLVKPTKDLKNEFKELGVTSGQELVSKTGSFQGALEALYQSVGENDRKFAKLFPDIRGLSAAFAVTGEGANEAKQMLKDFNVEAGRTQEVFKEQSKGEGFTWKQLSADVKQAAVDVGQEFAPATKKAGEGLHEFFETAHKNKKTISSVFDSIKVGSIARFAGPIGTMASQIRDATKISPTVKSAVKFTADTSGISSAIRKVKSQGAGLPDMRVGITIDNRGVKPAVNNTKKDLSSIPGIIKPGIRVISDAPRVTSIAQNAIDSVTGKTVRISVVTHFDSAGNADSIVNQGRLPGQAMGGSSPGGLVRVGEQGPELVSLPEGAHVYTAGQTRRMENAGMTGYAKGKKGKKLSRSEKIQRHNDRVQRRQRLRDLKSQKGTVNADDIKRAAVELETAQRHLKEAKRLRGRDRAEAIRQAQLEITEARKNQRDVAKRSAVESLGAGVSLAKITPDTADDAEAQRGLQNFWQGRLDALRSDKIDDSLQGADISEAADGLVAAMEAQTQAARDQIEATKAHTEQLKSVGESLEKQRKHAERVHTAGQNTALKLLTDMFSNQVGSQAGSAMRTASPIASGYVRV